MAIAFGKFESMPFVATYGIILDAILLLDRKANEERE